MNWAAATSIFARKVVLATSMPTLSTFRSIWFLLELVQWNEILAAFAELYDDIQLHIEPEDTVTDFADILILSRNITSCSTHDTMMRLCTAAIVDDFGIA